MKRKYVVDGAQLECTLGTAPGKLTVMSQQLLTIQGKLKATNKDKLLEPTFFGNCTCKSPNPPCSPAFMDWQIPGKKTAMGKKSFLMNDSSIQCTQGGTITVKDVNQEFVSTGEKEEERKEILPELQGEVIFVNGYLSNPITNTESHYNAVWDKNPDAPHSGAMKGENTDEHDRTHDDDIFTAGELEKEKALEQDRENMYWFNRHKYNTNIFKFTPMQKYWGYWNAKSNKLRATSDYCAYFNAGKNEHYINGSHGLGSNAAHRIDHGIALGYTWAKENWFILPPDVTGDLDGESSFMLSFTPYYKPVTVIGHSQGAAMAAGVAIGILKYAADVGWEKAPLNMIYLAVHQPKNLTGDTYKDLLYKKVDLLEVNRTFPNIQGEKEDHGLELLNSISDIFSEKYNKVEHKRGTFEHLTRILGDWNSFKNRSVQFTFANDRGDLVLRDGDIPQIKSACNPKGDTSLLSIEFYSKRSSIKNADGKMIIDLSKEGDAIGFIVLPPYIAKRRFDFEFLKKIENPTPEQIEVGEEWGDYRKVAIRWGIAFYQYKKAKKIYEVKTNKTYYYSNYVHDRAKRVSNWLYDNMPFVEDRPPESALEIELHKEASLAYELMLKKYSAWQTADLYAHFSPVGLINHKHLLSDFTEYCDDTIGTIESIWERIKKSGEKVFYRVEYNVNESSDELKEETKRIKEKEFVQSEISQRLLINSSIADTIYVQNVIDAFVKKNKSKESELYEERK